MSTRGVTASVLAGRPNADASSRRVPSPPPGPAWPAGRWSATAGFRPGRDARPPRQQEPPRSSWWTRSRIGTSRTIGGRRRSVPQHTHRAQGVERSRAAGSCRDRATIHPRTVPCAPRGDSRTHRRGSHWTPAAGGPPAVRATLTSYICVVVCCALTRPLFAGGAKRLPIPPEGAHCPPRALFAATRAAPTSNHRSTKRGPGRRSGRRSPGVRSPGRWSC